MYLLTYAGQWVEASARHPEQFVKWGPERLNRVCRIFGGRNRYGGPNLRLVRGDSRYQITGGRTVTILDSNKNVVRTTPAEVLVPRYMLRPEQFGGYILEVWRPVEWYMRSSQARNFIDAEDAASPIRTQEPIWPEGGYEAIENGPMNPWFFQRGTSEEIVRWAVFVVHLLLGMQRDKLVAARKAQEKAEREHSKENTVEELRGARRAFMGEPMVSYANVKGAL